MTINICVMVVKYYSVMLGKSLIHTDDYAATSAN